MTLETTKKATKEKAAKGRRSQEKMVKVQSREGMIVEEKSGEIGKSQEKE